MAMTLNEISSELDTMLADTGDIITSEQLIVLHQLDDVISMNIPKMERAKRAGFNVDTSLDKLGAIKKRLAEIFRVYD